MPTSKAEARVKYRNMNLKEENLIGWTFGHLGVIELIRDDWRGRTWKCICVCKNEVIIPEAQLLSGKRASCGCRRRNSIGTRGGLKHGMASNNNKMHPFYRCWQNIRQRCYDEKRSDYKHYGGRGIKMSDSWYESFENFKKDMFDGWREGLTIERKDVNENYCVENCCWIPLKDQAKNTRTNRFITHDGITRCLVDWARALNINYKSLHRLIKYKKLKHDRKI